MVTAYTKAGVTVWHCRPTAIAAWEAVAASAAANWQQEKNSETKMKTAAVAIETEAGEESK